MNNDRVVAQCFMEALWAGDLPRCGAMMSADARWHFQLGMPQAQLGRGRIWPAREALQRIVDDLFGKFDPDGFTVTLTRIIGTQGDIACEYEARGRTARGQDYQNYYVTALAIADGLVTEVRPYNDTAHMLAMLADPE
jgi:ketosteroid isomerase-like protein